MQKQKFNDNWKFVLGSGGFWSLMSGADDDAKIVQLPHDASVGMPRNPEEPNGSGNGFFHEETYEYTKKFSLPEEAADKNILFEFEGVYQNAFVYVNNAFVAKHPYGYGNFYIDITNYVNFGSENLVRVVVKNGVPSGRWYTGGGIYRDVNLMIADRLHLVPQGIHLATVDLEDDQAVIRAESTVEYTGMGVRDIFLKTQIICPKSGQVVTENVMPITIMQGEKKTFRQMLYVENPALWDDIDPNLYTYRAEIMDKALGEEPVDVEEGTFGIRKMQLDRKHGLRINGRVVKLRGGCIHHDNGVTGTAEFPHTAEFRVKALKDAGYNAIRSSHYPMSRRLLNACDKYGIYVMDEFSDVWMSTKVDFDYGMNMPDWWEYDVTNLVDKDYNHPCVIMYSIGNEIPEIGNKFDVQWGKKITDLLRSLDDSRYTTNSLNIMLASMDCLPEMMAEVAEMKGIELHADGGEINEMMSDLGGSMQYLAVTKLADKKIEEASAQVDIIGYNYAAARYEPDGDKYPNRIIVGSETFPKDLDYNWERVEKLPYVIGDFDWTAYDYLGEAGIGKISYNGEGPQMSFYSPYPTKAGYCGDLDLLGDRRTISYWRELIWGTRQAPYIAVQLPQYYGIEKSMSDWCFTNSVRSWTWDGFEGKPIVVEIYAAADEVELFANGVSLGRKAVGEQKKYWTEFDTVYAPGKLEAVCYKDCVETGRDTLLTASAEVHMDVCTDRAELPADGSDIGYAELALTDAQGTRNLQTVKKVSVSIEGPGVILGYGSADPESEENYFDTAANTYEGRLRAAVRATGAGEIRVTFSAENMDDVTVSFMAV